MRLLMLSITAMVVLFLAFAKRVCRRFCHGSSFLNRNAPFCLPGTPLLNCITPPIYKRRNPQDTALYQVVHNTFSEWSGNYSLRHDEVLPEYVEKEFKDYFKCGIFG